MIYEEQLEVDRPVVEEWNQSLREEIAHKRVILQDMLVLVELTQRALPRLDFNDPDQELAGNELLWLIGYIGATYERDRLERIANLKTPQYPLTAKAKCGTIDVYKYTGDGQ